MAECLSLPETTLPRCLIIDPDQNFAGTLARIIAAHGFETKIIGEPFAGLRELRAQTYDLILFDLSSQDGDAGFVLDELRRDMPQVLDQILVVTTNPLVASGVPVGVPVVGKSDLLPLMRYLTD
jgi:DNA-binding response OmpR family regulator